LKSAPRGAFFTLGVKAEIAQKKKTFQSAPPQVLIDAELYGLVLAPKRITIKFERPICNPWGQCSSIY